MVLIKLEGVKYYLSAMCYLNIFNKFDSFCLQMVDDFSYLTPFQNKTNKVLTKEHTSQDPTCSYFSTRWENKSRYQDIRN